MPSGWCRTSRRCSTTTPSSPRIYLDAYRAFGTERYREVATETLDYVLREMTAPKAGSTAAQDADSEGEEGKFYVWTPEEIDEILGPGGRRNPARPLRRDRRAATSRARTS